MILEQALRQWDDPYAVHELPEAEDIIHALRVELAGKEAVIDALHEDISHYREAIKDALEHQPYMGTKAAQVCTELRRALFK